MKDGLAEGGEWFGGQHFGGGRRPARPPALCSSSLVPCSAPPRNILGTQDHP